MGPTAHAPELVPDASLTRVFAPCLPGPPLAGPLLAFATVASTQHVARQLSAAGAPEGTMVLADHQTAGHGRRGRHWFAAPGVALLLSVVLRPSFPAARWPEITLAAACAVAEGAAAATGVDPRLRWPNDVLVSGRKLAGVIAEGVVGSQPGVVLGIGVNVAAPPGGWPPALATVAVSLAETAAPVSREAVLAAVLRRLAARYEELGRVGFEPVREAWRRRALLGMPVATPLGPGVAADLAGSGALLVRRAGGGTVTLLAGEIEPAPPDGPASA